MWSLASTIIILSGVAHASQGGQHRALLQRTPDNWPIKTGYVALGDSFGAGMGTGKTSSDACRVGSNNFGDLLNKWTNNANVDFQKRVCSGDTSVGLNRQIDEWTNPSMADVATISMGGNDLGFSNLVWYCVLTPNTAQLPSTTRQECMKAKDNARAIMADMGPAGLRSILKTAYIKVLDKSGKDDFHEPDSGRQDTWFFLSGWPDVAIEGAFFLDTISEALEEQAEVQALIKAGSVQLPDPGTCLTSPGTDPDPWELWKCRIAQDVAAEPNGDLAQDLQAANAEIANGEVNGTHIPGYVATRQIKTFHPRSPGMVAYRDAIIEAINAVQVNTAPPTGTCKMSITEIWTCESVDKNLYADIRLTGSNGTVLYTTEQSTTSPGIPINDANRETLKENGLPQELIIIGEHTNDYIQFYYGTTAWTSGTTNGNANCQLNGRDWNKGGPSGCPAGEAIVSSTDA